MYSSICSAGRTAYQSEKEGNEEKFIKSLISMGHESVLEHVSFSVRFICDRGVSHELVRHRLASFTQESTRYCKYENDVTFVIPPWVDLAEGKYDTLLPEPVSTTVWFYAMRHAELAYLDLLEEGWTPQQARTVLPNSLKTEIVMTANLREWRHFFKLRVLGTTGKPHPQMVELASPLLTECRFILPYVFGDLRKADNASS